MTNVGTPGHIDWKLTSLERFERWNPYGLAIFKQAAWSAWQARDEEVTRLQAQVSAYRELLARLGESEERESNDL